MLPNDFNAWGELVGWSFKLATVAGAMAWWHASDPKGDKEWIELTDELIEGAMDSDMVGKIKDATWNNLRDQVSIEQIEKWREEQEFRKSENRN